MKIVMLIISILVLIACSGIWLFITAIFMDVHGGTDRNGKPNDYLSTYLTLSTFLVPLIVGSILMIRWLSKKKQTQGS